MECMKPKRVWVMRRDKAHGTQVKCDGDQQMPTANQRAGCLSHLFSLPSFSFLSFFLFVDTFTFGVGRLAASEAACMAACSCSGMYNLPMLPARTSFRTFGVPDVSSPVPLTCVKLERGRGEEEKVEHRTQSVIGVEEVVWVNGREKE